MEEYVSRVEFSALKEEVEEIKHEMAESEKILQKIDKKIDVIGERLSAVDKINELKIEPLDKRVTKLEDSQMWMRRAILGSAIALVSEALIFVIKLMS